MKYSIRTERRYYLLIEPCSFFIDEDNTSEYKLIPKITVKQESQLAPPPPSGKTGCLPYQWGYDEAL